MTPDHPSFTLRYTLHGQPVNLPLTHPVTCFGADETCDIVIDSRYMSARHFEITVIQDHVYITDLDSTNGTLLNGRRLPPHIRTEWQPGDSVAIADVRFELVTPGAPAAPVVTSGGAYDFEVAPDSLRPKRTAHARLSGGTSQAQSVYFRADSPVAGLHIEFSAEQGVIKAGQSAQVAFQVHKRKPFLFGGTFRVPVLALTAEGQEFMRHVTVRIRPRYELLLALLFLLAIPTAIVALPGDDAPQESAQAVAVSPTTTTTNTETVTATETATVTTTASVTATDSPTASLTTTHTATVTSSRTATFTRTPSITPSSTGSPTPITPTVFVCDNQCAARGWLPYVIQPGDRLVDLAARAGVSVSELALVNCIGNPSQIRAGDTICLPGTVPPPVASCSGLVQTSPLDGLPQGPVTFYWDAPFNLNVSTYRVTVLQENGVRLASFETGGANLNLTADVSTNAIGGSGTFYIWQLEAIVNGQTACTLSHRLPRSAGADLVVNNVVTLFNCFGTAEPPEEFGFLPPTQESFARQRQGICPVIISFEVFNNATTDVTVPFQVSVAFTGYNSAAVQLNGLLAGKSARRNVTLTGSPPGCPLPCTVTVTADSTNVVSELNEGNNTYSDVRFNN